jgi:5'-methylthioadenosine nucleosidase
MTPRQTLVQHTNSSTSTMVITRVLIAVAMEAEAMPFVNHLQLESVPDFFPPQTPFKAFRGKHNSCELTVVTNGKDTIHNTNVDNVGTVPAAMATFLALQKMNTEGVADLLINAGTCGGFQRKGASIGDVFLTTAVANHDRRIAIPDFTPYGIGRIESTSVENLASHINAKLGVCTTGNSLDYHEVDSHHMLANDASVKDMEAAAIAWAAEMWNVKHFGVKVVTDVVDGDKPSHEEFLENLGKAAVSLQEALPKVIDFVCDKNHDEL